MTIAFPYSSTIGAKARMDRARFQDGFAKGTIAFAAQPSNNDTMAIAGSTFTFKSSAASGLQSNIGASIDASIDAAIAVLNASADANIVKCKYRRKGGAVATGNIAFAANPANNDTVTINGVAITFKSANPTGNQVLIGASLDATLDRLADFLNASANASLTPALYGIGTPVAATGSFTFSQNPANNDTITIGGTVVTFKTSGATGNQLNIGADLATTLTALKNFLNASADANVSKCTYGSDATHLSITAKTGGISGNAITLDYASTAVSARSAATLTGGKSKLSVQALVPGAAGNAFTLAASAATASGSTLAGGTSLLEVIAKVAGSAANALTLAASVATVSAATLVGGDSRRTRWGSRTAGNRFEPVDRSRWATRMGSARWVWTPGAYYP
ncbi:hypothetical protein [Hyphomicrobium sp.]|uniref:hypothetical protein n=1 Tax=Hyphomicrobium sp. TaxID=82 RepID=UPI001D4D86C5|nr:hypothetical protein [Hyphomicrobium sp.]MBY0559871.1 hypothetical protein [Hyphomicrobium sp.]